MALIACPGCGAPMWDEGTACPACKRPFEAVQRKKGLSIGWILLILIGVAFAALPVFAVLGVYGVRKYIEGAKTGEARNTLAQIANDAAAGFERDGKKRLCPSASKAVPADRTRVSGKKYLSHHSEWQVDARNDAGFACLGFELRAPAYFQYEYESTPSAFVVRAHGDLNGDGVFSTFEIKGGVESGHVVIDHDIREVSSE